MGREWIPERCAWLAIPVLLILELYHVKHRVWEVAAAVFGEGTTDAQPWAQPHGQRIEQGHAAEVIQSLSLLKRSHRKARQQIQSLETDLTNNLDRMDYRRRPRRWIARRQRSHREHQLSRHRCSTETARHEMV